MTKQFWINLPVKNVDKSRAFFAALGFKFNQVHGNTANSACMLMGDNNVVVMLFDEPTFKGFTNNNITDAGQSTEVLLSIDAESKQEVDDIIAKAIAAGAKSTHKPGEMQGWMYGSIFTDLDGHKWNVLFMDQTKMMNG